MEYTINAGAPLPLDHNQRATLQNPLANIAIQLVSGSDVIVKAKLRTASTPSYMDTISASGPMLKVIGGVPGLEKIVLEVESGSAVVAVES